MVRRTDIQYIHFYTRGTAAAKVAPVVREDPFYVPNTVKHYRKRVYVDPVAIVGFLVAMVLFASMISGISTLRQIQQEKDQLEQHITGLTQENLDLKDQYEHSYNLDQIENTALALGMVPAEELPSVEIYPKASEVTVHEEPTAWEQICAYFEELMS